MDYLKRAAAAKVPLIGVCTGSFILAEAGLMRYHQTCVSLLHIREFRERYPDHPVRADCIFNLDRRRGSCVGGTSAADLAATLVRHRINVQAERNALEVLQIDQARPALHIQPRRPLHEDFQNAHVKIALMTMSCSNVGARGSSHRVNSCHVGSLLGRAWLFRHRRVAAGLIAN